MVPRAWAHLLAIAAGNPLDPATATPPRWRAYVEEVLGATPPHRMTDGRTPAFRDWASGYDPESWLDGARDLVLDDLAEHGPSTARELGQRIRALARPLQLASGTQNEATQAAHTRVMLGLGFAGEVVRVQPTGSWVKLTGCRVDYDGLVYKSSVRRGTATLSDVLAFVIEHGVQP